MGLLDWGAHPCIRGLDASIWVTRYRNAGQIIEIAVEFNGQLEPLAR
jgi:hypothetical protein